MYDEKHQMKWRLFRCEFFLLFVPFFLFAFLWISVILFISKFLEHTMATANPKSHQNRGEKNHPFAVADDKANGVTTSFFLSAQIRAMTMSLIEMNEATCISNEILKWNFIALFHKMNFGCIGFNVLIYYQLNNDPENDENWQRKRIYFDKFQITLTGSRCNAIILLLFRWSNGKCGKLICMQSK